LAAREAVELGVEAAGGELLGSLTLLPAFPPGGILGSLRNRLRTGFCLAYFRFFADFSV
jgi:hypothetical protein